MTSPHLQATAPGLRSPPILQELPAILCMRSSSPIPSSLLPTPSVDSDEEDPLIAAGYGPDYAITPLPPDVATNRSVRSVEPHSLQAIPLAQHHTMHPSTPMARSPSADPLYLFSPPSRSSPSSQISSNALKAFPLATPTPPAAPRTPPPRSSRASPPTSPLTPILSPGRDGAVSPTESSNASVAARAPAVELSAEQLEAIVADDTHGRYSLRARLARQKNPYAYDKALYKRQMRSNPDAIVKVVSPRRRAKHRSRSAARSGSDGEYSGQDVVEVDPDDVLRTRRRKSRSRSLVGEAGADADDAERSPRPRSRHARTPSKPAAGTPTRHTSRKENTKNPPHHSTWQPTAFDETFSESDDGVFDDVANVAEEKKVRRKRARPFPLRKKDVVRRSRTPEEAAATVRYLYTSSVYFPVTWPVFRPRQIRVRMPRPRAVQNRRGMMHRHRHGGGGRAQLRCPSEPRQALSLWTTPMFMPGMRNRTTLTMISIWNGVVPCLHLRRRRWT